MEGGTPGWVVVSPLVLVAVGVVLSKWFLSSRSPADRELFWTERARREHPIAEVAIAFALLWKWTTIIFVANVSLPEWPLGQRLAWLFLAVSCAAAIESSTGAHSIARIGVIDSPIAQGWSVGSRIVLSSALLELLSPSEVAAVAGHEANHVHSTFARSTGVVLGVLPLISFTVLVSLPFGVSVLSVIAIGLLGQWLLRSNRRREEEHQADEVVDRAALARALEKLHERHLVPAVVTSPTTHPSLVERLEKLGHPPQWPIPALPNSKRPVHEGTSVLMAVFALTMGLGLSSARPTWFGRELASASPPPVDFMPVRRALAIHDCAAAKKALPPNTPSALRVLVDACGSAGSTAECQSIFESPFDVLAEEVQVAVLQRPVEVEFDRAWMLRQGLIPPPDVGGEVGVLSLNGRDRLTGADASGLSWSRDDSSGKVPWLAVIRVQGSERCWKR